MTLKVSAILPTDQTLQALAQAFPTADGIQLAGRVGGVEQLASALSQDRPDAVVLDLSVGAGESEMARIEAALQTAPGVHAIVISPDRSVEFLTLAMRSGVRQVLPTPLDLASLSQALQHLKGRQRGAGAGAGAQRAGQVLAMVGAKGGAGSTFLATNLAYALSRQGRRVAVIDLNMYLGDAGVFLGDSVGPSNVAELARQHLRLDGALLESSMAKVGERLHVLVAPESPEHVTEVYPVAIERLIEVARSRYDFVVLDISPNIDAIAMKALDLANVVYLTLQLSLPFVRAARRLVDIFRELGYSDEKIQLVVNRYEKGGRIDLPDVEKVTLHKVDHTIPNSHQSVMASVNQGIPLLELAPRDAVADALRSWAGELAPAATEETAKGAGWWRGLTGH